MGNFAKGCTAGATVGAIPPAVFGMFGAATALRAHRWLRSDVPALEVVRELVIFLKRTGGQSQFRAVLSGQIADAGGPLESLFASIADNFGADLRLKVLAERAGMNFRTFSHVCTERIGISPAKAVEIICVQAARESVSDTPLGEIVLRYGDSAPNSACAAHSRGMQGPRRAVSGLGSNSSPDRSGQRRSILLFSTQKQVKRLRTSPTRAGFPVPTTRRYDADAASQHRIGQ